MKEISFLAIASAIALLLFLLSGIIIPLISPVEAGSVESTVFSLCVALLMFVVVERLFDNFAIIKPLNRTLERVEGLADQHVGLRQSASFELFFERAKSASNQTAINALDGYWIALRRDTRRDQICAYIHRVERRANEVLFTSFDENSPGERYFVSGVVSSISSQAILYGKVKGRNSFHIYSLFIPAGDHPPYLFGTHFQTTLSGASSIATPVVFVRVSTDVTTARDLSVDLEHSDFLEGFKSIAKRHEDDKLAEVLQKIDDACELKASAIDVKRVVEFLKAGTSSVQIDSDMMDRHLDGK